jgi:hypothetical protein
MTWLSRQVIARSSNRNHAHEVRPIVVHHDAHPRSASRFDCAHVNARDVRHRAAVAEN